MYLMLSVKQGSWFAAGKDEKHLQLMGWQTAVRDTTK